MKVDDRTIPEELNWADYCDALADEMLLESQAKRMLAKPAPRARDRAEVAGAALLRREAGRVPSGAR